MELAIKLAEKFGWLFMVAEKFNQKELNNNSLKELKIVNKKSFYNFYMYINKISMANEILKNYLIANKKSK
ncbi:hypothetical protein [Providencia hangzhouensis]|uniref:hypothetical protein n=1 Tax=Providencia hangzhouensis TaxID=3031799 RepID=UPI00397B52FB